MEIALLVICIDLPPGGISNYDNTGTKLGDFFLICKYYLPPRIIASEPGYQVFVPAGICEEGNNPSSHHHHLLLLAQPGYLMEDSWTADNYTLKCR